MGYGVQFAAHGLAAKSAPLGPQAPGQVVHECGTAEQQMDMEVGSRSAVSGLCPAPACARPMPDLAANGHLRRPRFSARLRCAPSRIGACPVGQAASLHLNGRFLIH